VEQNKPVTLAADVFFVDGTNFLLTLLRQIKFIMVEYVAVCTAKSLRKNSEQVVQVYARAGFNVHTVLMSGEFQKVKNELPLLVCNTAAAKEHVSKAEHSICTIKECLHKIVCTLPFTYIPRQLKIELIYFVVLWLNVFPVKTGISAMYLPQECLV
jgi:hypothetical protein